MTDFGYLGNVYPFPHGPAQPWPNVHEQNMVVDSRFTVVSQVYLSYISV